MSTHEISLGFAWLYSTLSGDGTLTGFATGGVWRSFAPPGTTTPYVIMSYQSGSDNPVFGGSRAYSDMQFQSIAVGPAKIMQTILSAAARIDTLLTVTTQTAVTGGIVLASFRSEPVSTDEIIDGEMWNSTGGIYRLMIKAT